MKIVWVATARFPLWGVTVDWVPKSQAVERLDAAEAKLKEFDIEWEVGKGYVFTPDVSKTVLSASQDITESSRSQNSSMMETK